MTNPTSVLRSGMIELVEAAGYANASPIMQGVLAQPDGLITMPNEVVKDLLRRAEERAGKQPPLTRPEIPSRPSVPPRSVRAAH